MPQGGVGCEDRCKDNDPLCTAATDPHLNLDDYYSDSIFSQDPEENPAFYDYNIAYVPYCSSDWYTGTRNASVLTDGFVFHGKHIVRAIIDDLIQNTWVTEAEEVLRITILFLTNYLIKAVLQIVSWCSFVPSNPLLSDKG